MLGLEAVKNKARRTLDFELDGHRKVGGIRASNWSQIGVNKEKERSRWWPFHAERGLQLFTKTIVTARPLYA